MGQSSAQLKWVWQQPKWPAFTWSERTLSPLLMRARRAQGEVLGRSKLLDASLDLSAQAEILTLDGINTSAIEGETIELPSLRSSIARRLGLPNAGMRVAPRHVDGLVEVLLDATQKHDNPLTFKRLCAWQAALFPTGRSGLHEIRVGKLRGNAPMRIVSGAIGREKVHYEAPPHAGLKLQATKFLQWFNEPPARLDGLLRAGIAHLWFELLHPFEDGNGRVGRALMDMAIAQDESREMRLYSLSSQFMQHRDDYYSALAKVSVESLNITPWLAWFLQQVADAAHDSEATIAHVLTKARFWMRHAQSHLNVRQRKALNRMLDVGPDGFEGGMTNRKYRHLTGASAATAQRDLAELVANECLRVVNAGRSSQYEVNIQRS